jgi:hypothetical protein
MPIKRSIETEWISEIEDNLNLNNLNPDIFPLQCSDGHIFLEHSVSCTFLMESWLFWCFGLIFFYWGLFELSTLSLLGKLSTTGAMPPVLDWVYCMWSPQDWLSSTFCWSLLCGHGFVESPDHQGLATDTDSHNFILLATMWHNWEHILWPPFYIWSPMFTCSTGYSCDKSPVNMRVSVSWVGTVEEKCGMHTQVSFGRAWAV